MSMLSRLRNRGVLLVSLATAATALALPGGPAASGSVSGPAASLPVPPTIAWQPCEDVWEPGLQCARVRVPLDYDDPAGPTISLSVLKDPADSPADRVGSLFVNPGGPGGSSTEFAQMAARLLGTTVAQRYDVIGIDPRGVGGTLPAMRCRTELPDGLRPAPSFPLTRSQSFATWRFTRYFRDACAEGGNRMVDHMSTGDTARDMDLVRQALGEPLLNYYGISYGTQLGSTYASMFPEHVGRFVMDGVLDPVAWTTGRTSPVDKPFTTRLRSARGTYEAHSMALARCDTAGPRRCAFAGNAAAKWRRLAVAARNGTLRVYGDRLSYQDLVGGTLGSLYDSDLRWWAMWLDTIYTAAFEARPASGRRDTLGAMRSLRQKSRTVREAPYSSPLTQRATSSTRTVNLADPFLGVACSDTRNPSGREAWWQAGRTQDRTFRWFGSAWTWMGAPCAGWSPAAKQDAYLGPFGGTTATPMLVVGNSYDPATPVQGARSVTRLFPGSRFVLVDQWGHGALGNACITGVFDRYYATGTLPPEASVCRADHGPFPKGSVGGGL